MVSDVEEAFRTMPRQYFLPEDVRRMVETDAPLPIGFGQTNSQPSTVKMMLEWLEVQPGDKVLDVGSGSGWTTALLAQLTGEKGSVTSVDIIPELVEMSRNNCDSVGVTNAQFYHAGILPGWPRGAPYDRILVSASADQVPTELINQLKPEGRMVMPVRSSILIIYKDVDGTISQREQDGFDFVPLVKGRQ